MSSWITCKLGDIANINMGQSPPSTSYNEEGIGMKFYQGRIDFCFKYVLPRVYTTNPKKIANPGDILLTVRAPVGDLNITKDECCIGRGIASLRMKNHLQDFLYFLLKHYSSYWVNTSTGSVFSSINKRDIDELTIRIPTSSDEQKQIASILSSLDDKIELNLEMNKTLEEMAMAIYKEWFVDFGPFREGEFVDSELGPIPKGWEVKKIRDITKLHYGKALREKDRIHGAVPVYGSSGVIGYHNHSIVVGPSLIIGRKGNVGSIYWENKNSFPIDTVYYINHVPLYSLIHLYFKFLTTDFISRNSDSVVPGLNRKMAEDDPIIIPCRNVYNRFVDIVYPLFELKFSNLNENKKLIETRDYLLPKLISGEVRVKSSEEKLKEVL